MKSKIGCVETSTCVAILMLPMLVLNSVGKGISIMNSGYLINFIIICALSLFILKICKSGICNLFCTSKIINNTLSTVFLVFIFSFTLYNLIICTDALKSVSGNVFKYDILAFLPLVSATICALLGIEALTRCSYLSFVIIAVIFILMCLVSYNGWKLNNIYPVLGNDVKLTFTNFSSFEIFFPVIVFSFLINNFDSKNKVYKSAKQSVLIVSITGFLLTLICILSIPYPMGDLYSFSLEGIFSIAGSGLFFHRFEILLIFMILIFCILSIALGIYLASTSFASLTMSKDYKPFSIVIGLILFYLTVLNVDASISYYLYISSSLVLFIAVFIRTIIFYFKKTARKEMS